MRAPAWARVLVLCGALAAHGSGADTGTPTPPRAKAADIVQITLERDCHGCAEGLRLVLHRDGRAQRVHTGKARHGTRDRVAAGEVGPQVFAALARRLVAQGFFTLDATYEEAGLRDGEWRTLQVLHGPPGAVQETTVFRRDTAGPSTLKALEARIEAVHAGIRYRDAPEAPR